MARNNPDIEERLKKIEELQRKMGETIQIVLTDCSTRINDANTKREQEAGKIYERFVTIEQQLSVQQSAKASIQITPMQTNTQQPQEEAISEDDKLPVEKQADAASSAAPTATEVPHPLGSFALNLADPAAETDSSAGVAPDAAVSPFPFAQNDSSSESDGLLIKSTEEDAEGLTHSGFTLEEMQRKLVQMEAEMQREREESQAKFAALERQLASQRGENGQAMPPDAAPVSGRASVPDGEGGAEEPDSSLLREACREEETERAADENSLEEHLSEARRWTERGATLQADITTVVEDCKKALAESARAREALPSPLREALEDRQAGLEVIGRMLERWPPRAIGLTEGSAPEAQLPEAHGAANWQKTLQAAANEDDARKRIAQTMKSLNKARYDVIIQLRSLAESRKKRCLQFVNSVMLQALDGIEEGERNAQSLQEKFKQTPELLAELKGWLAIYGQLRQRILDVLKKLQVEPMPIQLKGPVDFSKHEPFDVEPDADQPNETIKAVTRAGYEYFEEGQEPFVLRAALVIVVKNPGDINAGR